MIVRIIRTLSYSFKVCIAANKGLHFESHKVIEL